MMLVSTSFALVSTSFALVATSFALVSTSFALVSTSFALVSTSFALVTTSFTLVSTSFALVTTSFKAFFLSLNLPSSTQRTLSYLSKPLLSLSSRGLFSIQLKTKDAAHSTQLIAGSILFGLSMFRVELIYLFGEQSGCMMLLLSLHCKLHLPMSY